MPLKISRLCIESSDVAELGDLLGQVGARVRAQLRRKRAVRNTVCHRGNHGLGYACLCLGRVCVGQGHTGRSHGEARRGEAQRHLNTRSLYIYEHGTGIALLGTKMTTVECRDVK